MLLREITKDIRTPLSEQELKEFAPLWAAAEVLFGAKPAGQYSDMSPTSQIYNALISQGKDPDHADSVAQEFKKRMEKGATPELLDMYKKLTGQSGDQIPYEFQGLATGAVKGAVASVADKATDTVTKNLKGRNKARTGSNSNISVDPTSIISKVPNVVKDPKALVAALSGTRDTWAAGIAASTSLSVPAATTLVTTLGAVAGAAGIMALLYGGKKLFDYYQKRKQKKKIANEEGGATAGGTAAAHVSVGAIDKGYEDNKKMAKGKRKNGAPQAPRIKPTDNGLDAGNLITGGSIKRR